MVKVEVPAVLAAGLVLDRLVIRAEHVRIAPGLPPRLQARPVGLRAYVSQANVDRWTRTSRLPIRVVLTDDGVVLTPGVGGIRMGEVLADLEVAGPFLRLAPKRMTIAGLPTPLVRFFRGYLPAPAAPARRAHHRGAARRRRARGDVPDRRARRADHARHRPPAPLAHPPARSPACASGRRNHTSHTSNTTIHPPRAGFVRWTQAT